MVRYDSPTHCHSGFDCSAVLLSSIIPHRVAWLVLQLPFMSGLSNFNASSSTQYVRRSGATFLIFMHFHTAKSIHPNPPKKLFEAKNPNTLRAKKWYGEYCVSRPGGGNWIAGLPLQPWLTRSIQHLSVEVGELGASVMYFNAISVTGAWT